jgi:hypothetical protein
MVPVVSRLPHRTHSFQVLTVSQTLPVQQSMNACDVRRSQGRQPNSQQTIVAITACSP